MPHIITTLKKSAAVLLVSLFAFSLLIALQNPTAQANDNTPRAQQDTVVLLHGLGRSKTAMWRFAGRLEDAGYRVVRIGYRSTEDTPERIIANMNAQLQECCMDGDGKIHFVGHSLGGLIARAYLAKFTQGQIGQEKMGRVVLIGTPNKGSHLVDQYKDKWWFKTLGPTAQKLGTDKDSLGANLPKPNYPLGVIAGTSENKSYEAYLPGPDDGLVTVASTKVDGMSDFITLDVKHSAMRNDKRVFEQAVHFLRTSEFAR